MDDEEQVCVCVSMCVCVCLCMCKSKYMHVCVRACELLTSILLLTQLKCAGAAC